MTHTTYWFYAGHSFTNRLNLKPGWHDAILIMEKSNLQRHLIEVRSLRVRQRECRDPRVLTSFVPENDGENTLWILATTSILIARATPVRHLQTSANNRGVGHSRMANSGVQDQHSNLAFPGRSDLDIFDDEVLTSSPANSGFAANGLPSSHDGRSNDNAVGGGSKTWPSGGEPTRSDVDRSPLNPSERCIRVFPALPAPECHFRTYTTSE